MGCFFHRSEVMAALSPSDHIDLAIKRLLHKSLLTSRNNDRTNTSAHPPPYEQPMKACTPTQSRGSVFAVQKPPTGPSRPGAAAVAAFVMLGK